MTESDILIRLKHLKKKIEQIDEVIGELESDLSNTGFQIGCRVVRNQEGFEPVEGRIISRNTTGKHWLVNRDGYAATITTTESQMTNLSLGTYGRLEREKWVAEHELKKLSNQVKNRLLSRNQLKNLFQDKSFQAWFVSRMGKELTFQALLKMKPSFQGLVAANFFEEQYEFFITTIFNNRKQ